jgi:uncharacterized DUF497 family protein
MLWFDWDEQKNKSNRVKHGIWFEEAQTVFDDPHGRLFHPARYEFCGKNISRSSLLQGI